MLSRAFDCLLRPDVTKASEEDTVDAYCALACLLALAIIAAPDDLITGKAERFIEARKCVCRVQSLQSCVLTFVAGSTRRHTRSCSSARRATSSS